MVDVFAVADILVRHIKTHYPLDVAIVGYYGSYLQGRATERSDLDFFFIPATSRGRQVELQFIIDGISFDFWPIGWERAENMAAFEDWSTTVIADCELLYVRSEEDLSAFMKLRETIADISETSISDGLLNKAEAVLRDAFVGLAKLQLACGSLDLSYARTVAHGIAGTIFQCLALINHTYYKRSWGHYREQVRGLPIKPERLEYYLDTIMYSRDTSHIEQACRQLNVDVLHLIAERHNSVRPVRSYKTRMKGYYEEERGMLNKLLTACEKKDYETAFFVAIGVQDGLARMLYAAENGRGPGMLDSGDYRRFYRQYGFPDLASLLNPLDFEPLRYAVEQLMQQLENHLKSEEVPMNRFDSIGEFEAFVTNREILNAQALKIERTC